MRDPTIAKRHVINNIERSSILTERPPNKISNRVTITWRKMVKTFTSRGHFYKI